MSYYPPNIPHDSWSPDVPTKSSRFRKVFGGLPTRLKGLRSSLTDRTKSTSTQSTQRQISDYEYPDSLADQDEQVWEEEYTHRQGASRTIDRFLSPFGSKKKSSADLVIAVMGQTGSGKSTFISQLSINDYSHAIGHTIESETHKVQEVECMVRGQRVLLVDTPGFDDTYDDDGAILENIAKWLRDTYKKDMLLSGLIYTHDISMNRFRKSAGKSLQLFKKLTGRDNMNNVVLLTTMWDKEGLTQEVGEQREETLQSKAGFFKLMLLDGATLMQHNGTIDSAEEVVSRLLSNTPKAVAIQQQMAAGRQIGETDAGEYVNEGHIKLQKQHRKEMEAMRWEMEQAHKKGKYELEKELKQHHDMVAQQLQASKDQQKRLFEAEMDTMRKEQEEKERQMREEQEEKEIKMREEQKRKERLLEQKEKKKEERTRKFWEKMMADKEAENQRKEEERREANLQEENRRRQEQESLQLTRYSPAGPLQAPRRAPSSNVSSSNSSSVVQSEYRPQPQAKKSTQYCDCGAPNCPNPSVKGQINRAKNEVKNEVLREVRSQQSLAISNTNNNGQYAGASNMNNSMYSIPSMNSNAFMCNCPLICTGPCCYPPAYPVYPVQPTVPVVTTPYVYYPNTSTYYYTY